MKNKIFALIFTCLTFFAGPVLAEEKIEAFDSLIQVQTDGSMIVTETITVHHEGINIRRGIYRDLPTKKGEKYELIGVTRNGQYEPSFVERRSGYYRINTGDDSFLPLPATSTFEIKYKVWNLPKSFDGYDEVYWNVTGDEWAFPIEKVSARVELPYGADIIQQASYIGYKGSTESATYEGNGQYSGHYLRPGEQLTVAVGFTPGIVSTERYISKEDMFKNIAPFVLYFVYLGFLIWVWHKKGRDPAGRAIMPQYEPPEELTAAQTACLYDKGVKKNLLAISFIQMISNGYLKLTRKNKEGILGFSSVEYTLNRTEKEASNEEELNVLWQEKTLTKERNSALEREAKQFKKRTEKEVEYYYETNRWWVAIPTAIAFFGIIMATCWNDVQKEFLLFFLIFIGLCYCNFASKILHRKLYIHLLIFLGTTAFITLYVFRRISEMIELFDLTTALQLGLILLTSSVFAFLLYQPTEKGQRLTEHLEGLEMFLKATKVPTKERLKIEEKLKQENLEKLFPYAMALGLEKEWENKFKWYFGTHEYHHFVYTHPYASTNFIHSFVTITSSSTGGSGGSGGAGGGGGGGGGGGR